MGRDLVVRMVLAFPTSRWIGGELWEQAWTVEVSLQAWAPAVAGLTRSSWGGTAVLLLDFNSYPWNDGHIMPGPPGRGPEG